MMKRAMALILSAVMLNIPNYSAAAEGWVTVSSWAYNDVSNFTKEGLLPDSLEEVSDYTKGITRGQFADMIYSVLQKVGFYNDDNRTKHILFKDTQSQAAIELAAKGIMQGESSGEIAMVPTGEGRKETKVEYNLFYPERELTREEMAEITYRLCRWFFTGTIGQFIADTSEWENPPSDFNETAGWARESVEKTMKAGIIEGVEDGRFCPKESFSVEQAICLLYRIYNRYPTVSLSDGAEMDAADGQIIQTYSNGLTETKEDNRFYIKDGENVLMEFEEDIYSNIYCATSNGIPYAAAQNRYGATDVYDLNTREIHSKLPYPTHSMDNEYIIVKSSNDIKVTFGLYDYDGKELLEPKYSVSEINEIRANALQIPYEEKAEASGWIYYANWEDNGRLYKIDSNGENKQKLTDESVSNVAYVNGWVFYNAVDFSEPDNVRFCCMKSDGTCNQILSELGASLCSGYYGSWSTLNPDDLCHGGYRVEPGDAVYTIENAYVPEMTYLFYDDEGVYYLESTEHGKALWYASLSEDIVKKTEISEGISYADDVQCKDNAVYFTGRNKSNQSNKSLYRYDKENTTRLVENKNIAAYGFKGDRIQISTWVASELDYDTYTVAMDGSDWKIDEEIAEAKRRLEENLDEKGNYKTTETHSTLERNMYHLSDEKYFVYIVYDTTRSGSIDNGTYRDKTTETIMVRDSEGNEHSIGINFGRSMLRINDVLYFYDHDETDSRSGHFVSYDLKTGESAIPVRNVYSVSSKNAAGSSWFTYGDYKQNICRYNTDTGAVEEVFPNGGLHKYGRLQRIIWKKDDGIYKVDTNGNYSFLLPSTVIDCIYVENGASEGMTLH